MWLGHCRPAMLCSACCTLGGLMSVRPCSARDLLASFHFRASLSILALVGATRPVFAQVVRITPKVAACDPALVDAAIELSGLKDFGKLMSAEVSPIFAQMEQSLRARGKRLLPEERGPMFEMLRQAFAADA